MANTRTDPYVWAIATHPGIKDDFDTVYNRWTYEMVCQGLLFMALYDNEMRANMPKKK